MLVDAELTARLATAGEEELTATFTRLKPQFSALLTHNQVAPRFLPVRGFPMIYRMRYPKASKKFTIFKCKGRSKI
jgi:hypothetical protein